MVIKEGDFIKLHYTGKLEDGRIFDTTEPSIAEKEGLQGTKTLEPVTICVGQHMLVKGLDKALMGKDKGSFSVTLTPEDAFGKKDPKLLRVIPTPQLLKQGIRPYPGLELNVDGNYGVVKRTGGGRTTVDFNHPLSSQSITYDVTVLETVTDAKEQITSLLTMTGLPFENITVDEKSATIKLQQLLPKPLLDQIQNRIVELTSVKTVSFEAGEQKK